MNLQETEINVLCIEDNEFYSGVVKLNLKLSKEYKFNVEQCTNLAGGIQILQKDNLHVVLLDLGLPDSDGLATLLEIVRVAGNTPIIVLTANNEKELVTRCLRNGAQDYIWKEELDSNLLIKSVVHSIERKRFQVELMETNQRLKFHMDNSPLAVVEMDHNFKIIKWSTQAANLFKKDSVLATGRNISTIGIMDPPEWEKFRDNIIQLLKSSINKCVINIRMNGQDGKIIYTECYITILFDETGKAISLLCLINDVSFKEAAETSMLLGQELERKRVAREIHDGLGQMLVAIKFNLNQLENKAEGEMKAKLEELDGFISNAIKEARSISMNIAERNAENISIEAQGRQLCESIKKLTGIEIKFYYIEQNSCNNNHILYNLYRILQEILNNIVKHSGASLVVIQLLLGIRSIVLKAEDNGCGFDLDKTTVKGRGLKNIEERVNAINGSLQIHSEKGKGTFFIIRAPVTM